MEKIQLNVQGMKCAHCKAKVEAAVLALEGVHAAEADLEKKQVEVDCDAEVAHEALVEAIEGAGRFYVE